MILKDAIKGMGANKRVELMTKVGGIYFRSVIAVRFLEGHPNILEKEILCANLEGELPEFELK